MNVCQIYSSKEMGLLDSCTEIVDWIIFHRKRPTIFNRLLSAKFDPLGDPRRVRAHGGSFPRLSLYRDFSPISVLHSYRFFVAHNAENLIGLNDGGKSFYQNIAFLVHTSGIKFSLLNNIKREQYIY